MGQHCKRNSGFIVVYVLLLFFLIQEAKSLLNTQMGWHLFYLLHARKLFYKIVLSLRFFIYMAIMRFWHSLGILFDLTIKPLNGSIQYFRS